MKHASLFSGIGGFDLAAQWMRWENVFQVEIDNFCQKVLAKNFPNVERYGDIKQFDGTKYTGKIDVLTGGFPCQPFSISGLRKGKDDTRYLWPEMLRVIREIKPQYVIGENVSEAWKLVEQICNDLEKEGYQVEPINITACSVGPIISGSDTGFLPTPMHKGTKTDCPSERRRNSPHLETFLKMRYNIPLTTKTNLNPCFVELIMGYPKDWTALLPSETPSSHKSPSKSSKQSSL